MRILVEINNNYFDRYADALGLVNGTNAMARAKRRFKRKFQDVVNNVLVGDGMLDGMTDSLIEEDTASPLVKALNK